MVNTTLSPNHTAFFICDMQEAFRNAIYEMGSVMNATKTMLAAAREYNIPCVITEQYPKGLKSTMEEYNELINGTGDQKPFPKFEKTKFSMITPEVEKYIKENLTQVKSVVIIGIETHVCVTQTCFDLEKLSIQPYVVVDGVSSMTDFDRRVALNRLQHSGVILSCVEQVLFELAVDSRNPHFKAISALVKEFKKGERKLEMI